MSQNQMRLDEVRKILLSLLLSRKGATCVTVLDRDYYDVENKRIPYRQFGFTNLVEFLQSMPEYFTIEYHNGSHYIRGTSEKSKHVSSLVARQKSKYPPANLHQTHRRVPHMRSQPVKLEPKKLFCVMKYIQRNPNGVSLQNAAMYVKQKIDPSINFTPYDLWTQLGELSHQVRLSGGMIYPADSSNSVAQQPEERQSSDKSLSDSGLPPIKQNICAAGEENFDCAEYFSDDNDFVPAKYARNQNHAETSELATNHVQYTNRKQTDMFNYNKTNDLENCAMMNSQNNTEMKIADCSDISQLVNDRTKNRLMELMRKHPEGIWCADLPSKYLQEYKVRLNYSHLGFVSVREFTSYLPNIFYMTQANKTDDFKLYSADKKPVVPKTDSIDIKQTSHNRHDEHKMQARYNDDDNIAPIPSNVSPTITKNFAPNDVMNYNDSVGKISVTDLNTKSFLGVYVVEVFNPSFFWIHLRENKKIFYQMMEELHDFYECNKNTYNIAKIALKKDMNCACVFMTKWHRAIIKSVKPDFRVTVLFYDYGTLKTYAPEDIYYLHKKFSILPAQAIPCGLYNVKPIVGENRWKKSVTDQFIDKIADTLLCATIITIDPTHNSMMVILTDTSEEDDLLINEWLVSERLAQFGITVRMNDTIYSLTSDAVECHNNLIRRESYSSVRVFHADSVVKVDNPRHDRTRSISHDERTHKLSDVKSEDIEKKTVKSLHNVPASKKTLLQMLWNTESLHAKASDAKSPVTKILNAKSQPRNPQNGKLRMPENFNSLKKLNSNSSTSTTEANIDNEGNTRQIDSSREEESQNNIYNYMNFSTRDSDDENDTKDFGTFRSLYGGRGLMEPFDWSVIREENKLPHKTTAPVPNNLEISIRERERDVENKSELHNQRNELPGKQYFLNMTRMEREDFLPEDNIEYDINNISDLIYTLRDKTAPNHIITAMFAPNNELVKTLHDSIQSEDTLNSTNTNIIELDDVASSSERNQKDKNSKVCEIRADQKIENRDSSNTDSELVFSNISNNKDNINGKMSKRYTNNSLKSNTNNKTYNPRYKMLLDKMQMDFSSNIVNTNESSSSEQIQSSSYSCNTSNDTIILSSDEPSTTANCMSTNNRIKMPGLIKELKSTSKELPENLILNKSHSNPEETTLSSTGTDSNAASFNVDDVKQRQLNNQSLETDSITFYNVDNTKQHQLNQPSDSDSIALSCNVDDSKCQLNVIDKKGFDQKLMQQMLKIVQTVENNSELDSDDLSSSRESLGDNKSDESNGDNKSVKLDCKSKTCKSTNDDAKVTEIAFAHPVFNDCDIESDESEWDSYACDEENLPFYIVNWLRNRNQ